jgi:histidyl-tRNA synthetase
VARLSLICDILVSRLYCTGVIYEVVTEGSTPATASPVPETQNLQRAAKKNKSKSDADEDQSNDPSIGVGSVAAGGRYDELAGMFSKKAQIPCVGISFLADRILSITKARMEREKTTENLKSNGVDIFVMALGKGFTGLFKEDGCM